MQTSMSVPAIMEDASTTVATQMGPITALVTVVGFYQVMARNAQVMTVRYAIKFYLYIYICVRVDINECSGDHGCQHNCHNTAGSHYCTCNSGWVLSSDGRTCTGR